MQLCVEQHTSGDANQRPPEPIDQTCPVLSEVCHVLGRQRLQIVDLHTRWYVDQRLVELLGIPRGGVRPDSSERRRQVRWQLSPGEHERCRSAAAYRQFPQNRGEQWSRAFEFMPAFSREEPIERREARLEVEGILPGIEHEPGHSSLLVAPCRSDRSSSCGALGAPLCFFRWRNTLGPVVAWPEVPRKASSDV